MDGEGGLSNDWELLHNALPPGCIVDPSPPVSGNFHGVVGNSEGVVQSEYFALDSDNSPNSYEFRLDGVATKQVVVEGSGEDESAEEEGPLMAVGHAPALGEGGNRCIVWWKLPFELLKFYAFRIGPLWCLSIAAAALGLVILGRKLYRMKHRVRRLRVNMGVDDKTTTGVCKLLALECSDSLPIKRLRPGYPRHWQ